LKEEELMDRMALLLESLDALATAKPLMQAILEMTEAQRAGAHGRRAFAQLTRLMSEVKRACQ
jgi:hypothetical protein